MSRILFGGFLGWPWHQWVRCYTVCCPHTVCTHTVCIVAVIVPLSAEVFPPSSLPMTAPNSRAGPYWLLKGEPLPHLVKGRDMGSYPFERFATEPQQQGIYTGVRNYTARNNIRDHIKVGDHAFYYHASCKEPGIAGIVQVVRVSADDDALDASHPFYDAKHTEAKPIWFKLTLKHVRAMTRFVSLTELKSHGGAAELGAMVLLRISRLSVQPVSAAEWNFVLGLEQQQQQGGAAADAPAAAAAAPPPQAAAASTAAAVKRKRGGTGADAGGGKAKQARRADAGGVAGKQAGSSKAKR